MWTFYRDPQSMCGTDGDPEPRVTGIPPRLCSFSVYDFPCSKTDCRGCSIWEEYTAKQNVDRLCPCCGAHLANWQKVFGERHKCP